MKIFQLPDDAADKFAALCSKIESNDNPNAKAKTSSASGRFQFIKGTWEGLGYAWKDVFNDKLQYAAFEKLSNENAYTLSNAGCAVNFATLYGAHFLGVAGLLRVMRASRSAKIETVTNAAQRKANPTILKGTVGDFCDWLERKTGDDVAKRYIPVPDIPVIELPAGKASSPVAFAVVIAILLAIAVIFVLVNR